MSASDDARRRVALAVLELRLRRGWSQGELARRAELTEAIVEAVERETDPLQIDTLTRLASAFGVDVSRLLGPRREQ